MENLSFKRYTEVFMGDALKGFLKPLRLRVAQNPIDTQPAPFCPPFCFQVPGF